MVFRQDTFSSAKAFRTDVKYDLPATVKALQEGWMTMFQSSAVVAGLFALIESQLLRYMKYAVQNGIGEESHHGRALLVFTYLALFMSLSAAMSSLILIDELGSITLRASRSLAAGGGTLDLSIYDEDSSKLLTRFNGGRQSWKWVMWHWIFTLLTGYICIVTQLVLYAWSSEENGIKGAVVFIAIITTLPLLDLLSPMALFRRMGGKPNNSD